MRVLPILQLCCLFSVTFIHVHSKSFQTQKDEAQMWVAMDYENVPKTDSFYFLTLLPKRFYSVVPLFFWGKNREQISDPAIQPDYKSVKGEGDWRRPPSNAVLFDGDPHLSDVAQGKIGDCFLLSAFIAFAHTRPDLLKSGIQKLPNGEDGQYQVRFFVKEDDNGPRNVEKWINVDDKYFHLSSIKKPSFLKKMILRLLRIFNFRKKVQHANTDTAQWKTAKLNLDNPVLWPLLYEKAFAKYLDQQQAFPFKYRGYDRIRRGGFPLLALSAITGYNCQNYLLKHLQRYELENILKRAMKFPTVGGSNTSLLKQLLYRFKLHPRLWTYIAGLTDFVDVHAYAVLGMETQDNQMKVKLMNPHTMQGVGNEVYTSIDKFVKKFHDVTQCWPVPEIV